MTPVTLHGLIVFVHVLSGVFLIGGSMFAIFVRLAARDARTAADLRSWLGFAHLSARFNPVAALVLLGTGVFLGWSGMWRAPWFVMAVALWVTNLLCAGIGVPRAFRRLEATLGSGADERPLADSAARAAAFASWQAAADVLLANDVATLYLMLVKPGWAVSLMAVLAVNLSLVAWRVGARLVRQRSVRTTPSPAAITGSEPGPDLPLA